MKSAVLAGIGIIALAAVGTAAWMTLGSDGDQAAGTAPRNGEMERLEVVDLPAPAVSVTAADGSTVTLEDYAGDVILVNFWATWCAPCVAEMPSLDRLQAELADEGLIVMPISMDLEGLGPVARFYETAALEHLGIYLDPNGSAPRSYEIPGLPTSVVIDRRGQWVGTFAGDAEWDSPDAVAMLRWYLEQPES